jgi:ubiquinone/menaquinone biosynthesis C-methylase UbiE
MSGHAVAAAYDSIAAQYDGLVAEDFWMRRVLWAHYLQVFRPGAQVLDVACGTGLDSLFLAACGIRMTGLDISPQMIAQLKTKAHRQGLADRIEVHVDDIAALHSWPTAYFDGIISAFAGLNTVSDLEAFAADAHRVLHPQGRLIVHVLSPTDVWKQLSLYTRLQWRTAWESGQRQQRTVVIAGRQITHVLLRPAEAYARFFAPYFRLCQTYALGFLWPQRLSRWLPGAFAYVLGRLEAHLGARRPFVHWGRFVVLDLEKSG